MAHEAASMVRPPVEINTLTVPLTESGLGANCQMCSMFSGDPNRPLEAEELAEYLDQLQSMYGPACQSVDRIFLLGLDPFSLPTATFVELLEVINEFLPNLRVITAYADIESIKSKSDAELAQLAKLHVDQIYVGVESAIDEIKNKLYSGLSVAETKQQLLALNEAGITHRDMFLLGAGGQGHAQESAEATARFINATKPDMVFFTSMTRMPSDGINPKTNTLTFIPAGKKEILLEEKAIIQGITIPKVYFWAAHPLAPIRLEGKLEEEKEHMVAAIDEKIKELEN